MYSSDIIRINGPINQVNDSVIAGTPVGSGTAGQSSIAGQLGKQVWIEPSNIIFQSTVGTLYGGGYRYVRYRTGDTPAPIVGQIAFWDTTPTNWQTAYQITREEDLSSVANAMFIAGIFIGVPTAGNYCFIQDLGLVPVKFRATLTEAGVAGSRVYAAGAGDGADEGYADVIGTADPANFGDVSLMQARYLGIGVTAPVGGALSNVVLAFNNMIG